MSEIAADLVLDAALMRRWIARLTRTVEAECDELTRLDAAIGDADHGINMLRGMRSALASLEDGDHEDSPAGVLGIVGTRLITGVGGAAGPIYGTAFRAMGEVLEHRSVGVGGIAEMAAAGLAGIQRLGAAEPGDKTIVDAWLPAVEALQSTPRSAPLATLERAEQAARKGMLDTIPLRARKGRASYLGWRSEGHQDPGATSTHMVFASLAAAAAGTGTD